MASVKTLGKKKAETNVQVAEERAVQPGSCAPGEDVETRYWLLAANQKIARGKLRGFQTANNNCETLEAIPTFHCRNEGM